MIWILLFGFSVEGTTMQGQPNCVEGIDADSFTPTSYVLCSSGTSPTLGDPACEVAESSEWTIPVAFSNSVSGGFPLCNGVRLSNTLILAPSHCGFGLGGTPAASPMVMLTSGNRSWVTQRSVMGGSQSTYSDADVFGEIHPGSYDDFALYITRPAHLDTSPFSIADYPALDCATPADTTFLSVFGYGPPKNPFFNVLTGALQDFLHSGLNRLENFSPPSNHYLNRETITTGAPSAPVPVPDYEFFRGDSGSMFASWSGSAWEVVGIHSASTHSGQCNALTKDSIVSKIDSEWVLDWMYPDLSDDVLDGLFMYDYVTTCPGVSSGIEPIEVVFGFGLSTATSELLKFFTSQTSVPSGESSNLRVKLTREVHYRYDWFVQGEAEPSISVANDTVLSNYEISADVLYSDWTHETVLSASAPDVPELSWTVVSEVPTTVYWQGFTPAQHRWLKTVVRTEESEFTIPQDLVDAIAEEVVSTAGTKTFRGLEFRFEGSSAWDYSCSADVGADDPWVRVEYSGAKLDSSLGPSVVGDYSGLPQQVNCAGGR